MAKPFKLKDLVPQRPVIEDLEGMTWEMAVPGDFDIETEALHELYSQQLAAAEAALKQNKADVEAARTVKEIMAGLIQIYVPKMPKEKAEALPIQMQQQIMIWWGEACLPLFMAQAAARITGQAVVGAQVGPLTSVKR